MARKMTSDEKARLEELLGTNRRLELDEIEELDRLFGLYKEEVTNNVHKSQL